jgi:DNA-binding XRE family transcriptional regulator
MRMNQEERRFDFHGLGAALKRAREEKGWTQAYVAELVDRDSRTIRFLYKGIIIKHNKTEPTYTKTSLFLCEKRRFFMARTEKGVVTTI